MRRSAMLPVARNIEGANLEAVPVIAVTKEDLTWFEFEADTHALLAMIDGHTTVRELLASVAVDPDRALELLRDLELQRVHRRSARGCTPRRTRGDTGPRCRRAGC